MLAVLTTRLAHAFARNCVFCGHSSTMSARAPLWIAWAETLIARMDKPASTLLVAHAKLKRDIASPMLPKMMKGFLFPMAVEQLSLQNPKQGCRSAPHMGGANQMKPTKGGLIPRSRRWI